MKKLLLILAAVLLSCGQPAQTALPVNTPVMEQPADEPEAASPEKPIVEPEPVSQPTPQEPAEKPEPVPEPPKQIIAPYGSTVIGETAYYVSNGAAMSLNMRSGEVRTISPAAREYKRETDYDYIDNADSGKLSPWTNNAVFIESQGALWIVERGYNAVKAQVITAAGIRDFGFQKQVDHLPLAENRPGEKIVTNYGAEGRFYRIKLFQYTDPDSWIPFKPSPIPDYILRFQEMALNPYAERPIVMGEWVDVWTVEKYSGDFIFEYLSDGRILAAGKILRLTAEGVRE